MSPAVAIFVKTPGLSPVKTRLARRIGQTEAETLHRRAAETVAESLLASGLPGYWAVAEPGGAEHWNGLPCLAQEPGSLGRRMAGIHATLVEGHGAGVLVGADAPQLTPGQLIEAADWLTSEAPRQVLGPARDGGFWLFGANRIFPSRNWTRVRYSQPDTAERFAESIAAGGQWKHLRPLTDLDLPGDLAQVRQELLALSDPTDNQRLLAAWLGEHLETAA